MTNVIGADRVRAKLSALEKAVKDRVDAANQRTGSDMVRLARVLHPGDGETKAEIGMTTNPDGSILVDFGSKAKVTEGDRGPRPFVNPTLKVIRKRVQGRYRNAVNRAVKDVFGG